MKKIPLVIIGILLASDCFAGTYLGRLLNDGFVPQPVLIEPTTETVDLTGKDSLDFKWSPHEQTRGFRSYYDFRLYKGYNMLQSTLIFKMRVDPNTWHIRLPASMFEDGQVYTWSLRQLYGPGRKSDRSYQPFKVIKR